MSAPPTTAPDTASPDDVVPEADPVTGPADLTTSLFYIPTAAASTNACQIADGEVICMFFDQKLDPSCTGEKSFALATFPGDNVTVECTDGGDASDAPALDTGQVVTDADGTYLCEGLEEGVKCTSTATGRTALMTSTQAGLLD